MNPEAENGGSSEAGSPGRSPSRPDAYPFQLDAVVLAGTHRNPKRLIADRNKAFLEVGGKKLVR